MENMKVSSFQKEVPIDEYMAACVDVDKFMKYCEQCPGFGKTWACPPFDFFQSEFWHKYSSILLYGKKIELPPELAGKKHEKSELEKVCFDIFSSVKKSITDELFALERTNPGSIALFAGKCDECKTCARQQGNPCMKPEYMRHSIESLGGDVGKSIELYFGEKIEWITEGRLPDHFFLLGALLKK